MIISVLGVGITLQSNSALQCERMSKCSLVTRHSGEDG
jgi:hypothetical protein